jgi:hypothetical protein
VSGPEKKKEKEKCDRSKWSEKIDESKEKCRHRSALKNIKSFQKERQIGSGESQTKATENS